MWYNELFLNGGTVALLRLRCWAGMTWMGQLDGMGMKWVVTLLDGSKVNDMDGDTVVLLDWQEVNGDEWR